MSFKSLWNARLSHIHDSEPAIDPEGALETNRLAPHERLAWNIPNPDILSAHIKTARDSVSALIEDTESITLHQQIYGTRFIKEVGMCAAAAV